MRAGAFADEWQDAHYEKGETQSFYNDFFQIFDVKRRSVAVYERRVAKLNNKNGFIDLFMPTQLLVEQKSAGRDLTKARVQAEDYFLGLPEKERPRYILACDFQTFDLYDLAERTEVTFALADLPDHVERFRFIMGSQKVAFKDQDPVNIKAAELVGTLHDQLEEAGFTGADLERFLVRIVFCLFADDTGVFQPRNLFLEYLRERTSEDGTDLGPKLAQLFQTLDTPEDQRGAHLDEDLQAFPYVNGDLFNGATRIPAFDADMRAALIEASLFDWSPISPAIFGSLFQSVMDKEERRKKGAHYTTEKNILKVIGPLVMDGLRAEFERAKGLKRDRRKALQALQAKMGKLTFFDPACGCGNFLIIAYRELRRLEHDLLLELYPGKQLDLEIDILTLSKIDVDQFHGIEIGEFASEIARAAMWMMDHIMNNELSRAFGLNFARIPLKKSANIVCADALEIDWADVLAPKDCDYVFGNPPFSGFTLRDEEKKSQAKAMRSYGAVGGRLDYVAFWFFKSGEYIDRARPHLIDIAFVATNSITQGEQVAQIWPTMFKRYKLELNFAHRTFEWGSDARGKAHVHCVIIGLTALENADHTKRLFSYERVNGEPSETTHSWLSPYLFDASKLNHRHLTVERSRAPAPGYPIARVGTKPVDSGIYIFSDTERTTIIKLEPTLAKYIRPFVGASEFIEGTHRWLFCPNLMALDEIRASEMAKSLIARVRVARENGGNLSKKLATQPMQFHVSVIPDRSFLVLPETTSSRREYVPFGWLEPPIVPSNKLNVVLDAEPYLLALVSSKTHISWLAYIGGRLKNDFSYSTGIVYNTFPWPDLTANAKAILTKTGQAILDARANHPGATLADLYDPDTMPPDLRKAHRENDRAVDRLYRKRPFESERERVEHLFALYEKLRMPLTTKKNPKRSR